jgi:translation initiation factor 6
MGLLATEVFGHNQVGVSLAIVGNVLFHPVGVTGSELEKIVSVLDVEPFGLSIGGSNLLGSLMCGNSNGIAVADIASEEDVDKLTSFGDVVVMEHGVNAAGNLLICTSKGALMSPLIPDEGVKLLSDVFKVPGVSTTIAGQEILGSLAAANNNGAILHPDVTVSEVEKIKRTLGVDVMVGTVGFGSPFLGAGIAATDSGAIVNPVTTGPELNRIEDALGYI